MKLFNVVVKIENIVELRVQAETESDACKKAEELSLSTTPKSSKILNSSPELLYETPFQVGSKVKHQIFGVGVITEIIPTTSGGGENGWRTKVEFEDKEHGTKGIYLSTGKPHLALL